MAINRKTPAGRVKYSLMAENADQVDASKRALRQKVLSSPSSRRLQYIQANPDLSHGYVYTRFANIPEHHHLAYTRIRLGSHRLRIETGRWARLPPEQRTCPREQIQTEEHVLLHCPNTARLRTQCPYTQCNVLASFIHLSSENAASVTKHCFDVLRTMSLPTQLLPTSNSSTPPTPLPSAFPPR